VKYVAIAATAARQRLLDRGAVVGRIGFYAILLFIFARLWDVVATEAAQTYVWYIAITEWIILSVPSIHTDVEEEVHHGDLVYRLTRPVPFPAAKLAEAFGDFLLRLAVLGATGFTVAFAVTGIVPIAPVMFVLLVPVGVLAGALMLVFHFTIGLGAFWLHDCRPLYWVWQKAAFILGGFLVPLHLYPAWLRELALVTPFSAYLYGAGKLALGAGPLDALGSAARIAGWLVVAVGVLVLVYRRALRRVTIGGG
jgi:ABC-2 type transport system permease protein